MYALTAVTQQTITTVTGFAAPVTLSGLDTTTKFMDHMKSKTAFILEENNSCTPKILFYGQKSSVCTMFSEQELIGGKICYEFQIDHSKKPLNGSVIYNVNNAVESIIKALEDRQHSIGPV